MKSELTEFSFGFAVASELEEHLRPGLVAAPFFPTLRQEQFRGWDVQFQMTGIAIFLQFKLADALTIASAAEWRHYGAPYYRIYMHKRARSNQHNLLKRLAEHEPHVYYVGPRFYAIPEFNIRYRNRTVVPESAWIPLSVLPWIQDNRQHYVTYRVGNDIRFSSPEPEFIPKNCDGKAWLSEIQRLWETERQTLDIERLQKVRGTLVRVLSEAQAAGKLEGLANITVEEPGSEEVVRDIAYLCRTFFGVEPFLLGQPPPA